MKQAAIIAAMILALADHAYSRSVASKPDNRLMRMAETYLTIGQEQEELAETPCMRPATAYRAIWYIRDASGNVLEIGAIDVRQRC